MRSSNFLAINREEVEEKLGEGIYEVTTTSSDRYTNPESLDHVIYQNLSELDWSPEKYRILDVGSSSGKALETLVEKLEEDTEAEFEAYTLDINQEMLKHVEDSLRPVRGVSQNLPFKDNSFDIVVSANLHLEPRDIEKTITEINRILNPEGKAVLGQGYNIGEDYRGLHYGKIN